MQGTDEGSLDFGLNRAMDAWHNDKAWFQSLAKRCMLQVRPRTTGAFRRRCRPKLCYTGV